MSGGNGLSYEAHTKPLRQPRMQPFWGEVILRRKNDAHVVHAFILKLGQQQGQKWTTVCPHGKHRLGSFLQQLALLGSHRRLHPLIEVLHSRRPTCRQHNGWSLRIGRIGAVRSTRGAHGPGGLGSCLPHGRMNRLGTVPWTPRQCAAPTAGAHDFPPPRTRSFGGLTEALQPFCAEAQTVAQSLVMLCHQVRQGGDICPGLRRRLFQLCIGPCGLPQHLLVRAQVRPPFKHFGVHPLTAVGVDQRLARGFATGQVATGVFGLS